MERISKISKLLTICAILVFTACDDDEPVVPKNTVPEISDQTFNASEAVTDADIMGTVIATDVDEDDLVFSITSDADGLFKISAGGALSLANGKTLDFESSSSHAITVRVSDSELFSTATITINVIELDENTTPVISDQSFKVAENITDSDIIGEIDATDSDGDNLTFSITANDNDLFEIGGAEGNALSLKAGNNLDFESATSHTITVEVSDGQLTASATITINVTGINENTPPEISDQTFEISEDIADVDIIGEIFATDEDGDAINFSIEFNDNNLFELGGDAGFELSLTTGSSLDYESATSHTITVEVSDGQQTAYATITINVTDVFETVPGAFMTTWQTYDANESILIPTDPSTYTYNYSVDWGDGTTSENQTGSASHSYATPGTYTVSITGTFPAITFENNVSYAHKLIKILQWGDIQWQSMHRAFYNCANMTSEASDVPDLSQVTSMDFMFNYASGFNQDISTWNVSNVTSMNYMFSGATAFNQDLSSWDVSNVLSMANMFSGATSFNGDIATWNVSSVTNMNSMLYNASSFNQILGGWDVQLVADMTSMLDGTGLSIYRYDETLKGWSQLASLQTGVTLGADGLFYCTDGQNARTALFFNYGWTYAGDAHGGTSCN